MTVNRALRIDSESCLASVADEKVAEMALTVLMNAGPWLPVPPDGYGGIEAVVATLVPQLRRAGARVILATVAPSTLLADGYVRTLAQPAFRSIAGPYNAVSGIAHAHMHAVLAAVRDNPEIDMVHDHLEVVGPAMLAAAGTRVPPVLHTLHWDLRKHREFYSTFDGGGRVLFAGVSESQLRRAPLALQAQAVGTVPLSTPPPVELTIARSDHVLVLARITPDKGQDIAARVCRRAGLPLVLAGPVAGIDDPAELHRRVRSGDPAVLANADVRFFLDQVLPHLDDDSVRWVGTVRGDTKERMVRSARALLVPNRWAEPGATAAVEAHARGVPVVATPLGALTAMIRDGVDGFLAETEDDLVAALRRVDAIDRERCREAYLRWTPQDMARSYLDMYEKVLVRCS